MKFEAATACIVESPPRTQPKLDIQNIGILKYIIIQVSKTKYENYLRPLFFQNFNENFSYLF